MSRRIDTGFLERAGLVLGSRKQVGGDDYLGRVAKYIPIEIVGLYVATSGLIPTNANCTPHCYAMWIVFGINSALVPLYFLFATTRDNKKPLWIQILLASIAFPVWVFALGGPFKCLAWYENWIASITLAVVTVAIGFYRPTPGS